MRLSIDFVFSKSDIIEGGHRAKELTPTLRLFQASREFVTIFFSGSMD